jgi:hypothetical protein
MPPRPPLPRRPEPLQTTRMLSTGLALWLLDAVLVVWNPNSTSGHVLGLISIVQSMLLDGGLIFLLIGMFLRATAWGQAWRDGTDEVYEVPRNAPVSERIDFPADDDPDF